MDLPAALHVDHDVRLELLDPVGHACEFLAAVEAGIPSVTRWLPHLLEVTDQDSAIDFLEQRAEWFEEGTVAEWGLFVDDELAGMAWITDIQAHNDAADIGYWLVPHVRGRGVATRVTARLLEVAFDDLDLHRISIRCISDNVASRAIPQRLGFQLEGTIRQAWVMHGESVDHVVYGLLAHEWRAAR